LLSQDFQLSASTDDPSIEEVRLLAACDQGRTPLMKPLIILAIETAMRRGEMLDLQWQHVDRSLRGPPAPDQEWRLSRHSAVASRDCDLRVKDPSNV
jgi:integrase